MPRISQVCMFNIPNFLGGSSVLANQGLQSSGLGGSSGSLTTVNPFGGGDPQRKNISGQPWVQEGPTKNDCLWSMQVTGSPTPCPPNHSHQPAPCGPCTVMGSPGETGVLDPTKASQTPGETNIACPEPTSPSPGKPGEYTWNQVTCTWNIRPGVFLPTKTQVQAGLTDEQRIDKRFNPVIQDCTKRYGEWSYSLNWNPREPRRQIRYALLSDEYNYGTNNRMSSDLRNFLKHVGISGEIKIGTIKLEPTPDTVLVDHELTL